MALNANIIFEIRQAGSANNGGGFRNNPFQSPPTIPAVTGSGSGGTVAAGTYYCVVTYTQTGVETPISPQQAVVLSGTTSSFTVTHPTDPGNATVWNLYVGTTSGGPYFPQGTALAIGSNRAVTTTPPTSGTQPAGTDRTLQASAQVAVDNSTITATTAGANSNVMTFTGYTPTGADVGNVYHSLTGTNINAGFYEVIAVTSTTWTVGGATNLTTAGGAGSALTGNMGGASDHPATINAALTVAGMIAFLKYSATPYTFTTSLTNNNAVAWIGYDTTRTRSNTDANRPILRAGANSITFLTSSTAFRLHNLDVDNPSATFTGATGIWVGGGSLATRCRFTDLAGTACLGLNGSGALAIDCEFVRHTGSRALYFNTAGSFAQRCLFRSCTVPTETNDSVMIECIVTACTNGFLDFGNHSLFLRCVAYGNAASGFSSTPGAGGSMVIDSCISYGNTGSAYGYSCGTATNTSKLINCRAGGNALGDYSAGVLASDLISGFAHLTGDPFTNAAAFDFSLNNTSGAGAACRGLTVPLAGGTTVGYPDVGVAQSQAAAGSAFPPIGCAFIQGLP